MHLSLPLLLLACLSCKDKGDDTGSGDGGSSATSELTLRATTGWHPDLAGPLVDAPAAIEQDGVRSDEITTDADGLAHFAVIPSGGPVTIIVDTPDFLESLSGIDPSTTELGLYVYSDDAAPETLTVTGVVAHESEFYSVHTYSSVYDAADWPVGEFALEAAKGEQVWLMAMESDWTSDPNEFFQPLGPWKVVDLGVLDEDTRADVDMSTDTLEPVEWSGTVALHPDETALNQDGGKAVVWVHAGENHPAPGNVGYTSHSLLDPEANAVDIDAEWVEIPGHEPVVNTIKAWRGDAYSYRFEKGAPDTWTSVPLLLPVPQGIAPTKDLDTDPYLRFEPKDVDAQRCVALSRMGTIRWLACDVSSDEVYVPAPLSTVDEDYRSNLTKVEFLYFDTDGLDYALADRGYATAGIQENLP